MIAPILEFDFNPNWPTPPVAGPGFGQGHVYGAQIVQKHMSHIIWLFFLLFLASGRLA